MLEYLPLLFAISTVRVSKLSEVYGDKSGIRRRPKVTYRSASEAQPRGNQTFAIQSFTTQRKASVRATRHRCTITAEGLTVRICYRDIRLGLDDRHYLSHRYAATHAGQRLPVRLRTIYKRYSWQCIAVFIRFHNSRHRPWSIPHTPVAHAFRLRS